MDITIDRKQYQSIIVYGIGQYYEVIKTELFRRVKPDFLCDRKWDTHTPGSYDGIPIIKRDILPQMGKILVIICIGSAWINSSVKNDLEQMPGIEVIFVDDLLGKNKNITGKQLKELDSDGYYEDNWGNRIYYDATVSDNVSIVFYGKNNILRIGRNVIVGELTIGFGSKGTCVIGDYTEVIGGYFAVSGAKLVIGKDCLTSTQILIRNHDGHHIFDLETHKRINYPRDIIIEDHVWIGYKTIILGGARIGGGSVIGAGTVTSGQFGRNKVIAGCPARVLRENICWSKDNTDYYNYDFLEETESCSTTLF